MAAPALISPSLNRISVEEYLHMEATAETKHEYVGGNVIAMAGATREHNEIVANLIREAGNCLKGKESAIYPSEFRVTTPAGRNYFYPDATVVCGNLQMQPQVFDTLQTPVVVFEVMREGTENNDRAINFFIPSKFHRCRNTFSSLQGNTLLKLFAGRPMIPGNLRRFLLLKANWNCTASDALFPLMRFITACSFLLQLRFFAMRHLFVCCFSY